MRIGDMYKESNRLWTDIVNDTRNGTVKVIPPPPGYVPPLNIKRLSKRKYAPTRNYTDIY